MIQPYLGHFEFCLLPLYLFELHEVLLSCRKIWNPKCVQQSFFVLWPLLKNHHFDFNTFDRRMSCWCHYIFTTLIFYEPLQMFSQHNSLISCTLLHRILIDGTIRSWKHYCSIVFLYLYSCIHFISSQHCVVLHCTPKRMHTQKYHQA